MSTHVMPGSFDPSAPGPRARGFFRLRPVGIDDWSGVRYVHTMAFRTFVAPRVTHEYTDAFLAKLDSPAYAVQLGSAALSGAWLDGQLAGTAGWRARVGHDRVAEIEALFVSPLFAFMGIGSALLSYVENQARLAGYDTFTATVPLASASFLMRFGYEVSAQLPHPALVTDDVPVVVMRRRDGDDHAVSDNARSDQRV